MHGRSTQKPLPTVRDLSRSSVVQISPLWTCPGLSFIIVRLLLLLFFPDSTQILCLMFQLFGIGRQIHKCLIVYLSWSICSYLSKCKFLTLDHEYHADSHGCYITYSADAMKERGNKCLSPAECKWNSWQHNSWGLAWLREESNVLRTEVCEAFFPL